VKRLMGRLRRLIGAAPGRHSAAYLTASRSSPKAAPRGPVPPWPPTATRERSPVLYVDPPTLRLPRVPIEERHRIFWDMEPVPLYVLMHEEERARRAA